jgi:hypothetical protein
MADNTIQTTVKVNTDAAKTKINQLRLEFNKLNNVLYRKMDFGMSGGTLGGVGGIFKEMSSGASMVASTLASGLSGAISLASTLSKALLGGAVAFGATLAAAVYTAHKALSPAAEFERFRAQLANMGKMDNLGMYKKAATQGPQDVAQVVKAAVQLESFGIDTGNERYLKAVQDASAMFGRDMSEVARILAKVSGGVLEQEQLLMIGLTRSDLGRQGIQFEKSGAVAEGSKGDLLEALIKAMEERSGGMAKAMASTYEGAISILFDAIKTGFADSLDGMLGYATQAVQAATQAVEHIGGAFAKIDWSKAGERLVSLAESARDTIKDINWEGIGKTFSDMTANALTIANALFSQEGRDQLMTGLATVWQSAIIDLNTMLGHTLLALEETWLKISENFLPGLAAAIFHPIWEAFSAVSGMLIKIAEWLATAIGTVISKIPGIGRFVNMDNMKKEAAGLQKSFGWDSKSTMESLAEEQQRAIDLERERLEKRRGEGWQTPKELEKMIAGLGGANSEATAEDERRKNEREAANEKSAKALEKRKEADAKEAREKEKQEAERRHRQMMMIQSQMLNEFKSLSTIAQADYAASMVI